MKFTAILLAILFSAFTLADNKSKTFAVSKGGTLSINIQIGDVEIQTWEKNEVKIVYEADGDEEEDEWNEEPLISHQGNKVSINASGWQSSDYEITIPSHFNIDAKVQAGDIKLNSSLTGDFKVATSGGDIYFADIKGNVSVKTGGGDVRGGTAHSLNIESFGGDISLGSVTIEANVVTYGGNIRMKDIKRNAKIKTAGGNVQLGSIGGDASVKSGGGNIKVGSVAGALTVSTGGGNIKIDEISKNTEINTGAGNIEFLLANGFSAEVEAVSNAGNINIGVPSNAKVFIIAETQTVWGSDDSSIRSDYPEDTHDKNSKGSRKIYKLNGGGKNVELKTIFGEIRINKK